MADYVLWSIGIGVTAATTPVGWPRAFQPWAPTEPCVTVSRYTALIILIIGDWRSTSNGRRAADTGA
jgi:hypothetical protein